MHMFCYLVLLLVHLAGACLALLAGAVPEAVCAAFAALAYAALVYAARRSG
jgi:hypothetical protein